MFPSKQPHRQRTGISPLSTSANGAARFSQTEWQLDCEPHVRADTDLVLLEHPEGEKAEYNQHLQKLNRAQASSKLIGGDLVRELIYPKNKSSLKWNISKCRSPIRQWNQQHLQSSSYKHEASVQVEMLSVT